MDSAVVSQGEGLSEAAQPTVSDQSRMLESSSGQSPLPSGPLLTDASDGEAPGTPVPVTGSAAGFVLPQENLDEFPDAETWTSLPPEASCPAVVASSVMTPPPASTSQPLSLHGGSTHTQLSDFEDSGGGDGGGRGMSTTSLEASATTRVHPLSLPLPPIVEPAEDMLDNTPASNPSLASPLPSVGDDSSRADTIADGSLSRRLDREDVGHNSVPSLAGPPSPGASSSPAKDDSFLGTGSLMGSFLSSSVAAELSAVSSEMDRARASRFPREEEEEEEILEVNQTIFRRGDCLSKNTQHGQKAQVELAETLHQTWKMVGGLGYHSQLGRLSLRMVGGGGGGGVVVWEYKINTLGWLTRF